MKIDLNHKLLTMKGKVVKERVPQLDENENQIFNEWGAPQFKLTGDLTLRKIIEETLFNPSLVRDPRTGNFVQISDEKKKACYVLLNRVLNNKDGLIELESEDQSLLKGLIMKKYNSPWTVGQARKALDPTSDSDEEEEEKPKDN